MIVANSPHMIATNSPHMIVANSPHMIATNSPHMQAVALHYAQGDVGTSPSGAFMVAAQETIADLKVERGRDRTQGNTLHTYWVNAC